MKGLSPGPLSLTNRASTSSALLQSKPVGDKAGGMPYALKFYLYLFVAAR